MRQKRNETATRWSSLSVRLDSEAEVRRRSRISALASGMVLSLKVWRPGRASAIAPSSVFIDSLAEASVSRKLRIAGSTLRSFVPRSEEHTSELPALRRLPYAQFCLEKYTKPE